MLLKDRRIFVVEDNASNLAVILTILRTQGAQVFYGRWGPTAVARIIEALPIELILLDLMLPGGLSGYDVFDQIRATPELADIPVVVVTAADPSVEMNKARERGLDGFLAKPLEFHSFGKLVADVLGGEKVWGSD